LRVHLAAAPATALTKFPTSKDKVCLQNTNTAQ
jgi:hypothetical protein